MVAALPQAPPSPKKKGGGNGRTSGSVLSPSGEGQVLPRANTSADHGWKKRNRGPPGQEKRKKKGEEEGKERVWGDEVTRVAREEGKGGQAGKRKGKKGGTTSTLGEPDLSVRSIAKGARRKKEQQITFEFQGEKKRGGHASAFPTVTLFASSRHRVKKGKGGRLDLEVPYQKGGKLTIIPKRKSGAEGRPVEEDHVAGGRKKMNPMVDQLSSGSLFAPRGGQAEVEGLCPAKEGKGETGT